jgi:hypothetical protein
MAYSYSENLRVPSEATLTQTFIDAMARVYLWMTAGLLLTAVVATVVMQAEPVRDAILFNPVIFFGIIIGQLGLVFGLSWAIPRISPATALGLFFLFAGMMGVTMSSIFIMYPLGTIGLAFGITTAVFGALSVFAWTTKRDLTKWGPILMVSLFGLIIASIVNMFLGSPMLDWIISYAGVLIFMGLTAYHTKHIKRMTYDAVVEGDQLAVGRIGVMGALSLYLSFINLFLFILRIVGGRR